MFPRAPKFLHGVLIAECLLRNSKFRQRSRGEVSAGTPAGRTEVERCFSSTRQIPHTRTQTHTLSYIIGQSSAQFTENLGICLTKFTLPAFPIPHTHISATLSNIHTALKINRARRFPQHILPSHSSHPHTHRVRLHTHRKALALSRKLAPIKRKKENHYVLYIEQTVVVLSTHILLHGCILVWYCCFVQDKLQYNEEPS